VQSSDPGSRWPPTTDYCKPPSWTDAVPFEEMLCQQTAAIAKASERAANPPMSTPPLQHVELLVSKRRRATHSQVGMSAWAASLLRRSLILLRFESRIYCTDLRSVIYLTVSLPPA
jgi:hypothetical protein